MFIRDSRFLFLFITACLHMVGIGLIIPSLPELIRRFGTGSSEITLYFGLFYSIYSFMQFLAAPVLGALSDRFGRKPILLLSLLIAAFDYLVMALAPNLVILFVARAISGLCGASVTVCMAYASDISTKTNRGIYFGAISGAFGLGFVIGPAIGGILGSMDPLYPFFTAALLNLINGIYGYFILPESLEVSKRRNFDLKRLNPFKSLRLAFSSKEVFLFCFIYFVVVYCASTHPAIWPLYTEYRFGWNAQQIGISLTLVGMLMMISQGYLSKILMPKFGYLKLLQICVFGNIFAYLAYAISSTDVQIYITIIFSSFFFVSTPAAQSLASEQIDDSLQGEFQGTLVSLSSLSTFLNPLISTQLFSFFAQPKFSIPGMPYVIAALMSVGVSVLILFIKLKKRKNSL